MTSNPKSIDLTLSEHFGASGSALAAFRSQRIHVTLDTRFEQDPTYRLAYSFCINLLSRTFEGRLSYGTNLAGMPLGLLHSTGGACQTDGSEADHWIVFGTKHAATSTPVLYANCRDWQVSLTNEPSEAISTSWNPVLALATACYAAARITLLASAGLIHGAEALKPFSILDFKNASVDFDWAAPMDIGALHLAGVGAVGSGFLAAIAAHGQARGSLYLVDHDLLEAGNLERYSFFTHADIGKLKVESAKARLSTMTGGLSITAVPQRLQQYFKEQSEVDHSFGIEWLVSAPDRRSTRREFQELLPRAVWDASTSPDEIVLHHNSFTRGQACLSCIYPATAREDAYFAHIAEHLGIDPVRVRANALITADEAEQIAAGFLGLKPESIIGRPSESVFKDLCSMGQLKLQTEDKVVLAPFAFISALAGVLLYLDIVRSRNQSLFSHLPVYNYTRINPFYMPNAKARELRASLPNCECCNAKHNRTVYDSMWGDA